MSELSGDFCRLMRLLAKGERENSSTVDLDLAKAEAQELFDAGEAVLGTNVTVFLRILTTRSYCQLRATFSDYSIIADHPIETGIKNEMSGNLS